MITINVQNKTKLMLGLDLKNGVIPEPLLGRLNQIDDLCKLADGRLVSRQIIALEVMNYNSTI
jgi:hypothetical protein